VLNEDLVLSDKHPQCVLGGRPSRVHHRGDAGFSVEFLVAEPESAGPELADAAGRVSADEVSEFEDLGEGEDGAFGRVLVVCALDPARVPTK
jgi:hypothetical protein